MRKEVFGQTGCYLSKCIRSIRKTVTTTSSSYISIEENIYAFTGSQKPSKPSPVARATDYVSPLNKQYWDVQTNNLRKLMAGMNEEYILDAIYMLRNENPEYREKIFNILIDEYDEFSQSYEVDGTDSAALEELNRILTEIELD